MNIEIYPLDKVVMDGVGFFQMSQVEMTCYERNK